MVSRDPCVSTFDLSFLSHPFPQLYPFVWWNVVYYSEKVVKISCSRFKILSTDHFIWMFPWWFTVYSSFVSFYNTPKPSPGRYACSSTWCQRFANSAYSICCRHLLLTCQYDSAYLIHTAWRGNKGLVLYIDCLVFMSQFVSHLQAIVTEEKLSMFS